MYQNWYVDMRIAEEWHKELRHEADRQRLALSIRRDEVEEHMYLDYRFGQIRQQEILEAAAHARKKKLTWQVSWLLRDGFVALSRRITRIPHSVIEPKTVPSNPSADCG